MEALDYDGWADDHLGWMAFMGLEELPPVHVVRIEKGVVRTFSASEDRLHDQVEYPSVLHEGFQVWLKEVAVKRVHIF